MAEIEIAGGRLVHYDVTGTPDAPPLLLIAGLGAPRRFWSGVVPALGERFRVVTIDNRDAGENPAEKAPYSMADLADDAAGLLCALGIARAHVAGISMGGFIAQHLAGRHPELVERLVLVGTSPIAGESAGNPLPLPETSEWIVDPVERCLKRTRGNCPPGFFDTRVEDLVAHAERYRGNRITFDGYCRQLSAISATHDARPYLAGIGSPTLVIHGDADPTVPYKGGTMLAEGIPGATLHTWQGHGHLPPIEDPVRFVREVTAFLSA